MNDDKINASQIYSIENFAEMISKQTSDGIVVIKTFTGFYDEIDAYIIIESKDCIFDRLRILIENHSSNNLYGPNLDDQTSPYKFEFYYGYRNKVMIYLIYNILHRDMIIFLKKYPKIFYQIDYPIKVNYLK